jgi:hypothetical protein
MMSIRLPDYPALLAHLNDAGMTLAEIAKETDINAHTLSAIKCERKQVDTKCLLLLRLFLDKTTEDVPYVGDHHEVVDCG